MEVLLHFRGVEPGRNTASNLLPLRGELYSIDWRLWIIDIFQETKQKSLEEIDLLFGERALGTLPDDLDDKQREIELERIENAKKVLARDKVTAVH